MKCKYRPAACKQQAAGHTIGVGLRQRIRARSPGERRDLLIGDPIGGLVGPSFRRDCDVSGAQP